MYEFINLFKKYNDRNVHFSSKDIKVFLMKQPCTTKNIDPMTIFVQICNNNNDINKEAVPKGDSSRGCGGYFNILFCDFASSRNLIKVIEDPAATAALPAIVLKTTPDDNAALEAAAVPVMAVPVNAEAGAVTGAVHNRMPPTARILIPPTATVPHMYFCCDFLFSSHINIAVSAGVLRLSWYIFESTSQV